MKITINKTTSEEIELPNFFKVLSNYYMVLDEQNILAVRDLNEPELRLYPCIEQTNVNYLGLSASKFPLEAITEKEFKDAFVRVSLELEKLAN
jgi:hypothetical protein